jgi:ADP-ribose pyrophosphatase
MAELSELADEKAAWPVVQRRSIYQGYAIDVHVDRITTPSGGEAFDRDVVDHVGAVGVLAVNDRDEVLVVRQYRHPTQLLMVELPAGLKDAGEEPAIETAKRELVEEGHVAAREWSPLIAAHPSPGFTSERFEVFLARDIVLDQRADDFEAAHEEAEMERAWVPFQDLLDAVLEGRVCNGMLVLAVLAFAARRQRIAQG